MKEFIEQYIVDHMEKAIQGTKDGYNRNRPAMMRCTDSELVSDISHSISESMFFGLLDAICEESGVVNMRAALIKLAEVYNEVLKEEGKSISAFEIESYLILNGVSIVP